MPSEVDTEFEALARVYELLTADALLSIQGVGVILGFERALVLLAVVFLFVSAGLGILAFGLLVGYPLELSVWVWDLRGLLVLSIGSITLCLYIFHRHVQLKRRYGDVFAKLWEFIHEH